MLDGDSVSLLRSSFVDNGYGSIPLLSAKVFFGILVLACGVMVSTTVFGAVRSGSTPAEPTNTGVVVQLVRTTALQAVGRGFDYRQLHKKQLVYFFNS